MSNVRRVYVEKKPAFAVKAKELKHEIKHYLGISTVTAVRELIRYDVENISDEVFEKACKTVFAEPPVDDLYLEKFDVAEGARVFSVEFLPGQFDQRADSAVQCVQFLDENAAPIIRSATTYVIEGTVTDAEFEAIKHHCINPVDSRETGLEKPETLVTIFPDPEDVKIFDGFKDMAEADLKELYASLNLAMTFKDFQHIQNYFRNEEKRDPSMTEIRVLDTYWSDHCRHTTFSTELTSVKFDEGDYKTPIEKTYKEYLDAHKNMYKGRDDKFVCLMDLALMAMKKLKAEGKLADQEEKEQWRKLWEETASLTWIYNIEETQKLCNLRKAIPTSQKQEYRYTMQTVQEIQNAFGIFMEEQEYENLQEPEKLTEKIRQDLWQRVQNGEGQAVTEILILKAVLFIEDHLVDSEVKAEQIADAVGMSRSYFSVCFKKCTGYSVNSYIRKERIALACRLLRENPQISAEQMADAVGYHDEKYFVKLFQQSMGIGFAEYKKQLKRQEF